MIFAFARVMRRRALLLVTMAGGCLSGAIGLVLAAPLLSAGVRIAAEVQAAEQPQ